MCIFQTWNIKKDVSAIQYHRQKRKDLQTNSSEYRVQHSETSNRFIPFIVAHSHPSTNLENLSQITISYRPNESKEIRLQFENSTIPFDRYSSEIYDLIVLGTPINGEKISRESIWTKIIEKRLTKTFLRSINGEFLLILLNKEKGDLRVINDRYTSIPFFYTFDDSEFFGSVYYKDLWKRQQTIGKTQINEYAIFEFLWLQRLLGTKTYDTGSSYLLAARILAYSNGALSTEQYWEPSFTKTGDSIESSANALAESLRRSLKRKTSDNPGRVGLFLSGGTDSRTILSAFDSPPTSFTIGVSDNNEVKVARKVADISGSDHQYVPFPSDPYSRHIDDLTMLGGGMHAFDHSIFFGLNEYVSPHVDVVFHGHGIDYMFQGMYLLTENRRLFGRRLSFKRLQGIGGNFPNEYLTKIGHRLKDVNLDEYVIDKRKSEMKEHLRNSVVQIERLGDGFCETPDDHWEYLLIHGLSRHYPFTNLSSMGSLAEQRVAAFDNDVFDIYLSIPASHRLDGRIAKQTLKALNPRLASVPTANTNERPSQSPLSRDLSRLMQGVKRRSGLGRGSTPDSVAEERTWPDRGRMFSTQPKLREYALDAANSDALNSLGFLDMDKLRKDIPEWLDQPQKGPGALLTFLVTIDRFMKSSS